MPARGSRINAEQLLRIADSVPAAVTVYNINTGQYLYVSKMATAVLGYAPEEFIAGGLEFTVSLVHPDDVQELMAKNQEALDLANLGMSKEDEPIAAFEYRMLHKDGSFRWVKTDGTVFGRSANGNVELILNITLDISDQKRVEIRLRRGLKLLQEALHEDIIIEQREIEF